MRSITIGCISLLVGCSFLDDFDKFQPAAVVGEDDGGAPHDEVDAATAAEHDASDTRDTPDAASGASDAASPRDGGKRDGSVAVDAGGPRCGDGVTNAQPHEDCDDGNQTKGDGCEPDCTFTPPPQCGFLACNDMDACTVDVCNPPLGCQFNTIDADKDGFSPGKCAAGSGQRGGDCNDGNAAINPGATDACDGIDNDCDGVVDNGAKLKRCYPDADHDGYPALDSAPEMLCICPRGTVSVADPSDRSQNDCWDDPDTGADAFPGQTEFFEAGYGAGSKRERSFDYNCDGMQTPHLKALPSGGCAGLLGLVCGDTQGFAMMAPACGDSGAYTTCGAVNLTCEGTMETRKQACN